MIRFFDLTFSLFGCILLFPLFGLLWIIGWFDTGSAIFKQKRVGRHQMPFYLYKFRSMKPGIQSVATHLASASDITTWGAFLRRSKLDELPQLWNVLLGDMSLVGPRPCLNSQTELIEEREKLGVFNMLPGITGLAQINSIDMSTPVLLAQYDAELGKQLTVGTYFGYIFLTVLGKGAGDRIRN